MAIGYFDFRFSISGEYLVGGLPRFSLKGNGYLVEVFKSLILEDVSRMLTSGIFSRGGFACTKEGRELSSVAKGELGSVAEGV